MKLAGLDGVCISLFCHTLTDGCVSRAAAANRDEDVGHRGTFQLLQELEVLLSSSWLFALE